jgi:hypothetical protein
MKKYFTILSAIIFLLLFVFLPNLVALAQFPSFEIYSSQGGTSYPTVVYINIPRDPTAGFETITANATDISGVYSMTAEIKDPSGNLTDNYMQPTGSGNYVASIDTSLYLSGRYYVSIIATDNLLNSSKYIDPDTGTQVNAYSNASYYFIIGTPTLVTGIIVTGAGSVTSIVSGSTLQMNAAISPADADNQTVTWSVANETGTAIIDSSSGLLTAGNAGTVTVMASATDGSGVTGSEQIAIANCATANGTTICVAISTKVPNATQLSLAAPSSANAGGDPINLSATLTGSSGPIQGETITFTETDPSEIVTTIGTGTTDSNGNYILSYQIPITTAAGTYSLMANYAGNPSEQTLPSSSPSSSLDIINNCSTVNGTTICVAISTSP